jgi:uncharacterized protein (TIGR00730 family)
MTSNESNKNHSTIISVFSGSKENDLHKFNVSVKQLFQLINKKKNITIAYGGGKTGLMKEIFEGCINNNIPMISVNCERWKTEEEAQVCLETHYFDSILDRQNKLINIANAYIVLPGGVGTLYEMLQAVTCNDVKETNKPIFVLNVNNYFMHLFDFLDWGRKCGMILKSNTELNIHVFNDPFSLVSKLHQTL